MEKLFQFAKNNDLQKLRDYVTVNYQNKEWLSFSSRKSGDTVLTYASRHGNNAMLEWLHKTCGADLEMANFDGKRPLHEACQFGQRNCVEYLIREKVQIDCLKRADWTPLMLACTKSDLFIVRSLLIAGANPFIKNKDGWNAFHVACREGHTDVIELLLQNSKDIWNTKSKNGRSPLHTAALHGKFEAVEVLVNQCQYLTDERDSCGSTPLMDALRAGHVHVAKYLIQYHQADVLLEDNLGRQAVHLVAQAGCMASMLFLLTEHNVDVSTQSSISQVTPLHVASKEGQNKMVELLICHNAQVNATDHKGRTALHIACGSQHEDCVRTLLHNGAVDTEDNAGNKASSLATKTSIKQLFS